MSQHSRRFTKRVRIRASTRDIAKLRALEWAKIRASREEAERLRQLRAFRLGRDHSPMPGYPDHIGPLARTIEEAVAEVPYG